MNAQINKPDGDSRRERFRQASGRFGEQPHDRADGIDLGGSFDATTPPQVDMSEQSRALQAAVEFGPLSIPDGAPALDGAVAGSAQNVTWGLPGLGAVGAAA